jgi:hypothetical protein
MPPFVTGVLDMGTWRSQSSALCGRAAGIPQQCGCHCQANGPNRMHDNTNAVGSEIVGMRKCGLYDTQELGSYRIDIDTGEEHNLTARP